MHLRGNGTDAHIEHFESIRDSIGSVVGVEHTDRVSARVRVRLEQPLEKRCDGLGSAPPRPPGSGGARRASARARTERAARAATRNHLLEGKPNADAVRPRLSRAARGGVTAHGAGELPARNVANVGYLLYADHLLAVELAGTLLLVATVGAVAIAQRRGSAA